MAINGPLTLVQSKAMNIEYKCPLKAMHFPNLHRQHLERAWNRMTGRLIDRAKNRARKARELRFPDPWVRMTCRLIDPSMYRPSDRNRVYRRKLMRALLHTQSSTSDFSSWPQLKTRDRALQVGRSHGYRHVALNTDSIDTVEVGTQTES